jgi:hypothetical protein
MFDILGNMYAKILTIVILFACLGSFAQAGVISRADWDSAMTVPCESTPETPPVKIEKGLESESFTTTSSSNSSVTTAFAMCLTLAGVSLSPNLVGYLNQTDWSLPACPILDGLIKPA